MAATVHSLRGGGWGTAQATNGIVCLDKLGDLPLTAIYAGLGV